MNKIFYKKERNEIHEPRGVHKSQTEMRMGLCPCRALRTAWAIGESNVGSSGRGWSGVGGGGERLAATATAVVKKDSD